MVKEFSYYQKQQLVKRQSPDRNLAHATYKESLERLELAKRLLQKEKAKYVLENAYESLREAADAVLYTEGFKSYSHEASISFLRGKIGTEQELREFDRFRKIRNDIKYYGGDCEESDAKAAIKLAEKLIPEIKRLLKEE